MVNIFVAITDYDWFVYLRSRPDLTSINFWQPGGQTTFRALKPGELFLFKLHAPRNFIVGGGIFSYANIIPLSLAWEAFGEANGAKSLQDMGIRISRYREELFDRRKDFHIGCRILEQPFFFEQSLWISPPASWNPHTQQGKLYSTDETEGRDLWDQINSRWSLQSKGLAEEQMPLRNIEERARYGEPTLIRPRLGQGTFRLIVTDAYERRCAVTDERTLPALEAAHIRPFADGGIHEVRNGILLRRDIHPLFDRGYVTINRDFHFEVSKRIHEEFDNGKYYYSLHGQRIRVPKNSELRPDSEALEWHNNQKFMG